MTAQMIMLTLIHHNLIHLMHSRLRHGLRQMSFHQIHQVLQDFFLIMQMVLMMIILGFCLYTQMIYVFVYILLELTMKKTQQVEYQQVHGIILLWF